MMSQRTMKLMMTTCLFLLAACTPQGQKQLETTNAPEIAKEVPLPEAHPAPEETPNPPVPNLPGQDPDLKLCSKLDLKGVVWPSDLSVAEWSYYALGLNITGSFEGREGWKNIAGNADGQGMSLGLMQQNFGQGTLQPWLIEMYNFHNSTMISHFNNQDYKNLRSMLDVWKKGGITNPGAAEFPGSDELFPVGGPINKLDIGYEENELTQLASDSSQSVQWAKQNILDSKGNVSAKWKKSFQDMATSDGYRSYQLAASTTIFNKAKQYFNYFKFRELRFLLFFFDIVVQNGSIKDEHLSKYNSWLKSNPNADDQARALALLEARLTTVRPQYVQDVRSRKSAIIYGTGTVHQTLRNFPREYCFDPRVIIQ